MATDLQTSLKNAAEKISEYIDDVATMTVETQYVQVGITGETDFEQAKVAARTVVKLDGDCHSVVPMRQGETGGLEVQSALLDIHQRNVLMAIEYRAKILNSLVSILQPRLK